MTQASVLDGDLEPDADLAGEAREVGARADPRHAAAPAAARTCPRSRTTRRPSSPARSASGWSSTGPTRAARRATTASIRPGFGLENFDAVGAWRDKDGELADRRLGQAARRARSFSGPGELKAILKTRKTRVRPLPGREAADLCPRARAGRVRSLRGRQDRRRPSPPASTGSPAGAGDRQERPVPEATRLRTTIRSVYATIEDEGTTMTRAPKLSRRTVLGAWARPSPCPGWRPWRPAAGLGELPPVRAARPRPQADGVPLRPQRRAHGRLDAQGRGSRLHPAVDARAARAVQGRAAGPHRPGPAQRRGARRRRRRPRPVALVLPDRRPPAQDRRGRTSRRGSRSTRSPRRSSAARRGCPRWSSASSAAASRATAIRAIAAPTRRTSPGGRPRRRWPRRSIPAGLRPPLRRPRQDRLGPPTGRSASSTSKSILDFVLEDAQQLRGRLGLNDRRKLDEYLDLGPRDRAADRPGRRRRGRPSPAASAARPAFPRTIASTSG